MIAALLSDLWPYLAGLGALLLGVLGIYRRGKADQRRETALEAAERMGKAAEAGRKAETKARKDMAAGATPDDVLRRNDGEWS